MHLGTRVPLTPGLPRGRAVQRTEDAAAVVVDIKNILVVGSDQDINRCSSTDARGAVCKARDPLIAIDSFRGHGVDSAWVGVERILHGQQGNMASGAIAVGIRKIQFLTRPEPFFPRCIGSVRLYILRWDLPF
jgi:hypothetical protein